MKRLVPLLLAAVLAGCGTGPDPAPSSMTSALARVDKLVAAHQYSAARLALEDLVRTTAAAREAGTIDDARADRVLTAAARLGAALPRPALAPSPAPSPTRDAEERDGDDKGGGKKKGKHD